MTRRPALIPELPHFAAWLKAQGHNQASRAMRIGVTERCVSYWEHGQRWPTVEALRNAPDGLLALVDDLKQIATKGR